MSLCNRLGFAILLLLSIDFAYAQSYVWLPSVALDQRFDDNYRLQLEDSETVSATRFVGNLGLNRESQVSRFRGLLRADLLVSAREDSPDEQDSNQFAFFDTSITHRRSLTEASFKIKHDTPNRDISTDITDLTAVPADAGARNWMILTSMHFYLLSEVA